PKPLSPKEEQAQLRRRGNSPLQLETLQLLQLKPKRTVELLIEKDKLDVLENEPYTFDYRPMALKQWDPEF
ncbi:hypothetical protein HAX54_034272, partial [Datura stramonium]|nr:hypothetical protein [Datura stramonium]